MECVQNGDSSHISGRCHLSFTNMFANPGPNFRVKILVSKMETFFFFVKSLTSKLMLLC